MEGEKGCVCRCVKLVEISHSLAVSWAETTLRELGPFAKRSAAKQMICNLSAGLGGDRTLSDFGLRNRACMTDKSINRHHVLSRRVAS